MESVTDRRASSAPGRALDELGALVRHISRLTGSLDDSPTMTATQRLALFELTEHGPLRLNELAHRLGVSAPTATRAVDALETRGWAERVADPDDRRAQRVGVTAQGRACVAERRQRALEAFAPAAAALTAAELETLRSLVVRLREALIAAEPTARPPRDQGAQT
jgi:DNA-binding MarR family transcriptional regulator